MNNPISNIYIKFMEYAEPYIKKFPYIFIILMGLLIFLGALFNWKWLCKSPEYSKIFLKSIYEIFGYIGYRIALGIIGFLIIAVSIFLIIVS